MKSKVLGMGLICLAAITLMAETHIGSTIWGANRAVEFTYTATIKDIPIGAKKLRMWIPVLATDNDQTILDTRIESPYTVVIRHDPEWGNRMFVLEADAPKNFTFTATYNLIRSERKLIGSKTSGGAISDQGQYTRYLRPSKMSVVSKAVRAMADKAIGDATEPMAKARAIYDYIIDNMSYDKTIPGWGRGDVQRICLTISDGKKGTGNCTDFHSLFESMMRSVGIPVRFEMGYPLKANGEQTELKNGGYHCWAQFFIANVGWIPVDISEASKDPSKRDYFFGAICENRVHFSTGRDINLTPQQKGASLNYFGPDPYIEVDGKPFKGFTRAIKYTTK